MMSHGPGSAIVPVVILLVDNALGLELKACKRNQP